MIQYKVWVQFEQTDKLYAKFSLILISFSAGVFWESSIQAWWTEALPNAGDSRHRSVRAVEDGPVQELHPQWPGGPGGQNPGTGAALDKSLPGTEVRQEMDHLIKGTWMGWIFLYVHLVKSPYKVFVKAFQSKNLGRRWTNFRADFFIYCPLQ